MSIAPYSAAIKAVGNALKSVFDFASNSKDHQAETEIIKDKRRNDKALNVAELAFQIVFKNIGLFSAGERKRVKKLYKRFLKCN